jgi:hypothetical protein
MKKKKVIIHSTFSKFNTGFSKNSKQILKYLYKTGKYDLIEFASGNVHWSSPELSLLPWKVIGCLPDDLSSLPKDVSAYRSAQYGQFTIDKLIQTEKPDVYIGIEDIWAFNGSWDKKWWNTVNHLIWTTIDSLPILPLMRGQRE